jgi:hypothetical protein
LPIIRNAIAVTADSTIRHLHVLCGADLHWNCSNEYSQR